MDQRLNEILQVLLVNVDTLNGEIMRFGRCQQFTPTKTSFELIEHIRESCTCSLQHLRSIERELYKRALPQENDPKRVSILRLERAPL